ncbi:MAG: pirin family protein [Planctomycetota bacterium]|nr:pirin family protein [Planctomycetota bacterium]
MKSTQENRGPALEVHRAADRGRADYGWLQANYSFSFASYYDPARQGFGLLRVLNQDMVLGGGGFATHGHRDMEIVTFVQSGELVHEDSMGNRGVLGPGEVQVMSAGTGIQHSEANHSATEPLHLLQMWVVPAEDGTAPRWEQRLSPDSERLGRMTQLVGPHAEAREGLLTIGQDARLFATLLDDGQGSELTVPAGRRTYVHVARGELRLDGLALAAGDGASLEAAGHDRVLTFEGAGSDQPADVVVWDLP